jgi:hypothetical protein
MAQIHGVQGEDVQGEPPASRPNLFAQLNLGETLGLSSNMVGGSNNMMEGFSLPRTLFLKQGLTNQSDYASGVTEGLNAYSGSFSKPVAAATAVAAPVFEETTQTGNKRSRSTLETGGDPDPGDDGCKVPGGTSM